jgi:hypothetical protein
MAKRPISTSTSSSTSTSAITDPGREDNEISPARSDESGSQESDPQDDYREVCNELVAQRRALWVNRFASPQAFLQAKFANVRGAESRSNEIMQEKLNTRSLEYVAALWEKQEGKCYLSGLSLEWTEEAYVRKSPYMANVVKIIKSRPYGEGNQCVVCECIAMLVILFGGVDAVRNIAKESSAFLEFKHDNPGLTAIEACRRWDVRESKSTTVSDWKPLTPYERMRLADSFSARRHNDDKRSPRTERQFAEHCVGLYEAQRGRCAITGKRLVFSFDSSDRWCPSVDRIGKGPHIEGNVWITGWFINRARGSWPADVFSAVLRAIGRRAV